MAAVVPHRRPTLDTSAIESSRPVGGEDWSRMANLANFGNGHGGMLIPWCAIGRTITSAAHTFHFYVGPKKRAVERVWRVTLTGTFGTTATIKCGGSATLSFALETSGGAAGATSGGGALAQSFEVRESLTAKTNTAGDTSVVITTTGGKTAYVSAISMYEQTRASLDLNTDDYGVDVTSTHARQPIADFDYRSTCGVADAYKNLDARRAGIFHWSTETTDPLDVTQVGYTDIFPLYPPALAAVSGIGTTTSAFKCAVYAKVNAGSANVKFSSTQQGSNVVNAVSGTSYAWVTGDLTINAEDLSATDGLRSSAFETIRIEAQKGTATTLSIAGLSVIRVTAPI